MPVAYVAQLEHENQNYTQYLRNKKCKQLSLFKNKSLVNDIDNGTPSGTISQHDSSSRVKQPTTSTHPKSSIQDN
jgi:hypothetical protein